jgi:hypothetical protein
MEPDLDKRISFLEAANIRAREHSTRGLFDHLLGTRQLLLDWGARTAVCDAGLFHSVYGTEHYLPSTIPFTLRDPVINLIGPEAERLAWLFCVMHRESFDANRGRNGTRRLQNRITGDWMELSEAGFADLVNLTFANTLEALPRLPWHTRRACRSYLKSWLPHAMPPAQKAFAQTFGKAWQFWR